MNHAKRLKKSLEKLDKIQQITEYFLCNTPKDSEYREYMTELRRDLEYLSIEKKEHRVRFAKKVLTKRFIKNMKFFDRIALGFKFIFFGKVE